MSNNNISTLSGFHGASQANLSQQNQKTTPLGNRFTLGASVTAFRRGFLLKPSPQNQTTSLSDPVNEVRFAGEIERLNKDNSLCSSEYFGSIVRGLNFNQLRELVVICKKHSEHLSFGDRVALHVLLIEIIESKEITESKSPKPIEFKCFNSQQIRELLSIVAPQGEDVVGMFTSPSIKALANSLSEAELEGLFSYFKDGKKVPALQILAQKEACLAKPDEHFLLFLRILNWVKDDCEKNPNDWKWDGKIGEQPCDRIGKFVCDYMSKASVPYEFLLELVKSEFFSSAGTYSSRRPYPIISHPAPVVFAIIESIVLRYGREPDEKTRQCASLYIFLMWDYVEQYKPHNYHTRNGESYPKAMKTRYLARNSAIWTGVEEWTKKYNKGQTLSLN